MVVRVQVPIRLRVDAAALGGDRERLREALAAAAGRALGHSRIAVLERHGAYLPARLSPATFTWLGAGLGSVDGGLRAAVEHDLAQQIHELAERHDVTTWGRGHGEDPAIVETEAPTERFDHSRFDERRGRYRIPVYDDGKDGDVAVEPLRDPFQPPAKLEPVKHKKVDLDDDAVVQDILRRLRSSDGLVRSVAFLEISSKLAKGDGTAIWLATFGLREDGSQPTEAVVAAIKKLDKRYPGRLRPVLREILKQTLGPSANLMRKETDISVSKARFPFVERAAAIVHLYEKVEGLRSQLRWLERRKPGTRRVIALIETIIKERSALADEVAASPIASKWLSSFKAQTRRFDRFIGIVGAQAAGQSDAIDHWELQADLLEYFRWLTATRALIGKVERLLKIYDLLFRGQSAQQDEVVVLSGIRDGYLATLHAYGLPKRSLTTHLITHGPLAFAGWRAVAGDRKKAKVAKVLGDIEKVEKSLGLSAHYGYYGAPDRPYNARLQLLRSKTRQLRSDFNLLAGKRAGATYLDDVIKIERELPALSVQVSALSIWQGALQVSKPIRHPQEIGSQSERTRWWARLSKVTGGAKSEFDAPRYDGNLGSRLTGWQQEVESVLAEIKSAARRELFIEIAITIVAVVVTLGAGAALAATRASVLVVTIAEAGTFTAVTTAGRAVLLDRPIDPGTVAIEFVDNAVLFGAFRIFGGLTLNAARAIAPGRSLAQLSIIFGSTAVVTTGVPLVIRKLENGELDSEEATTIVVTSLLLNVIVGVLVGPKMLRGLKAQNRVDIVARLEKLRTEANTSLAEMEAIIKRGGPSEPEFEATQAREAKLYREIEWALGRMASSEFSDAHLAALGLTRAHVNEARFMAKAFAEGIAGAKYVPPATTAQLAAPNEVITAGLKATTPGTFEYNPNHPKTTTSKIKGQLESKGWTVKDDGAGILRLTGGRKPYLLLPARSDVPAPALARLTGSSRTLRSRGLKVLQQQNAVPPLEARLTSLATGNPDAAKALLEGIGRNIKIDHVQELQAIEKFLARGGKPETLGVLLANGRVYGAHSTRTGVRALTALSDEAIKGLDTVVAKRGSGARGKDSLVGILKNFPDGASSVLATLRELAPRTDSGMRGVIQYLASTETNLNQAGLGSLRAARKLLAENPTARIDFEVPVHQGTVLVRVIDVRVKLPAGSDLGVLKVEVKEVQDIRILKRGTAVSQFSRDLVAEANDPVPSTRRILARLKWFVRRPVHADGSAYGPAELATVRDEIKKILADAFKKPRVKNHARKAELRQDFDDNFDKILIFF